MTASNNVLVKHMGHDGPWLTIKTRKEVKERIAFIKDKKPKDEIPRRLQLLAIVSEPLPPGLKKAYTAREKAYLMCDRADEAREKADEAREKAYAARKKAHAAWQKAIKSREGVAFHKKVCGCSWSPQHTNILEFPITEDMR